MSIGVWKRANLRGKLKESIPEKSIADRSGRGASLDSDRPSPEAGEDGGVN
jgi:hypothetical protein